MSTYGEVSAEIYDEHEGTFAPDADIIADRLHELANGGPVLELGIGTGRVAVPLAEKGISVHGIEASAAMMERLKSKPGGENIPVTYGDFADVTGGPFTLIFAVFNTFAFLPTQADQLRCFRNVARALTPDGVFVIELALLNLSSYHNLNRVEIDEVHKNSVVLETMRFEPYSQKLEGATVVLSSNGLRVYPARMRIVWPGELDLMAQIAGMRLRERWENWSKEAAVGNPGAYLISVYELATDS